MFHLYGLFIGLAVVAGWSVAEHIEPKVGKVLPWILVLGLVGARLYHVVDLWEYYGHNWGAIVAVWNGGLGIWGGVAGGGVAILIYQLINVPKYQRNEDTGKMLGAMATGLPLAQAIGRLGNAVNGEFVEKVWVLPWWSAEAIGDLILFGLIWSLRGQSSQERVGVYLAGYGVIRFVLEFWRVNNWVLGGLGVAQWMSLLSIVIGLWVWQVSAQD